MLDQDIEWQSSHDFGPKGIAFEDERGNRWLELHPCGKIRVLKNYAWDGCSPKFFMWDIAIGTPDGIPNYDTKKPKTYLASLVHDVLYQFLDDGVPLKRRDVDQIFLQIMTEHHFAPRRLYYYAVRIFGGGYRQAIKHTRRFKGRWTPL